MNGSGFTDAAALGVLAADEPDEDEDVPPAAAQADDEISYESLPSVSGFELGV